MSRDTAFRFTVRGSDGARAPNFYESWEREELLSRLRRLSVENTRLVVRLDEARRQRDVSTAVVLLGAVVFVVSLAVLVVL